MKYLNINLLLLPLILVGCATANKMNQLSIGANKQRALEIMGQPDTTAAHSGREYMVYRLYSTGRDAFNNEPTTYFVRIVDGKVDAFGRQGDFDSTQDPTTNININRTTKKE